MKTIDCVDDRDIIFVTRRRLTQPKKDLLPLWFRLSCIDRFQCIWPVVYVGETKGVGDNRVTEWSVPFPWSHYQVHIIRLVKSLNVQENDTSRRSFGHAETATILTDRREHCKQCNWIISLDLDIKRFILRIWLTLFKCFFVPSIFASLLSGHCIIPKSALKDKLQNANEQVE